jgi:sulfite exporter TauE/SafE/copper chaperone CopZ
MDTKTTISKFFISGLHCPSCEILIEKKLIKLDGVEMVDVSISKNQLTIEHHSSKKISPSYFNKLFHSDGYRFSKTPFEKHSQDPQNCPTDQTRPNYLSALLIALFIGTAFLLLNKTGFTSLVSVNSSSSLPIFILFGILAGFSTCAALTGGIILSLSQQWLSQYSQNSSNLSKLQPHLMFNLGRVLGYGLFGFILGLLGNYFTLSPVFTAALVILVSFVMATTGLQMLGVKALSGIQFSLPKSLTSRLSDEANFSGRFGPLIMGALTFFLPCGFTITAQALALNSGNPISGALIMSFFAIGTIPGLLSIGFSSVKFGGHPATSKQFSTIAGILVLLFSAYNVNSQMAVLGYPGLENILPGVLASTTSKKDVVNNASLPPIVNGVQILKMEASARGYFPANLTVRAGVPVRWEITDTGTSGCTNAIISRALFTGQIDLTPGQTSIKEFTISEPGNYRFSCWMGMVTGTIQAVDENGNAPAADLSSTDNQQSGGCGCGSSTGTCGGI